MLDLTSSKVLIPSVLFAILSPGVILQLPDKIPGCNANAFMSRQMSKNSVIVHAMVFSLIYKLITKQMGIPIVKMDIIVPAVLFILLSPGLLLSLPSTKLASGQTSPTSVLIHAFVFAVVFAFLRKQFPKYY